MEISSLEMLIFIIADVGIIIGATEEWGKGYGTEAFKLALSYGFNDLNLFKVTAGVYANNMGSIKALEKSGFQQCGKYTKHCVYQDKRVDVFMYEALSAKVIG